MTKATSLTLIALGAILAFAVNGHPPFLNVQVVGWVIMATGVAGLLVPHSGYDTLRRRIVRKRYGSRGGNPAAGRAQAAGRAKNDAETVETIDDVYTMADPADGS